MGALSSFLTWNPEDDLLLKNAVEAGASLESLAKGAVQFSQRFTIRELEDRWRSLLYDLNTSTEASTRIIDIEIGVSAYNPSKPGRACNSKVKETSSGRRKGESLQSHYHTTRKKARSELPKSVKSGFLMSPSSHAGNDGSSHDHLKLKSEFSLSKFHVDVPFSDNYGHSEASCGGGQHIYGKMAKVESTAAASSLAFHGGNLGSIEAKLPVGFSGTDCLYRHGENISSIPIDEAGYNDAGDNFESNLTPKDFPHALDRNHCSSQTSNVPGSTPTFHQLGYSSPSRSLPIWKTVEDVSTPTLQMDEQFKVKCQGVVTGQCIEKIDDQACDNVTPKSKLSNDTSTAALNNSAIMLDANFIDFNNPGMCFTVEEELLLIDVDEVDIGDGSCLNGLSSMFLSSPTSTNMDNLPIPAEPKPSEAFVIPTCKDADNSVEDGTIHEQIHDGTTDLHRSDVPVVCALSSSSGASPTTASVEKLMICVLNTEDQDIPRNDDVTFPTKLFQAFPNSNLRQDISSTMAYYGKATSGDSSLVKEGMTANVQPNVPNCKAGHSLLPKVGLLHSTVDSRIESLSPERDLICGASNLSNKDMDVPSLIPAITSQTAPDLSLKQDTATELNMQVACMPSHPDLVSSELGFVDPFPAMSISDQEELFENEDDDDYDNDDDDDDDDIPNSSDVEAMILGMDLGPYDQESCLFAKEVSRYQCMETKKTIIRLEQGARSYMNRAISSHGAFAIFYGRKLKYFIRNPTVLLGRETGEIKVDIDLAIEGRANQISRRQAIIKMDEDGYFLLRNIGKCSIFVNSKEVPFKKRINLCSCALIEIRDMRFIFEVNEVAVRRHIASSRQIRHGPKSEFDFVYR